MVTFTNAQTEWLQDNAVFVQSVKQVMIEHGYEVDDMRLWQMLSNLGLNA